MRRVARQRRLALHQKLQGPTNILPLLIPAGPAVSTSWGSGAEHAGMVLLGQMLPAPNGDVSVNVSPGTCNQL